MAKLKLTKGCTVRLRYDITTRNGITFRAGLLMRVAFFETRYVDLRVRVRARVYGIRLEKRVVDSHLELVSRPPAEQEDS